jgi:rubredoxin
MGEIVVEDKWQCFYCGYEYDPQVGDPDNGVAPPAPFEALSDSWICPECGALHSDFSRIEH